MLWNEPFESHYHEIKFMAYDTKTILETDFSQLNSLITCHSADCEKLFNLG